MKTMLTTLIVMLMITAAAQAAWVWESGTSWGNQIATPAANTSYDVHPGWNLGTEDWYWDAAWAIGFADYGWFDINGGDPKSFGMKMQFSQPIASLQFTTPQMNSHICAIDWSYSTDGTNWTTVWHRDAPGDYTTYYPEVTALQTFSPLDNVTQVWIHYGTSGAYAAQTITDGNMVLAVTTTPEPATLMLLALGALGAWARKRR